jgi:protein ImuB
MFACLSLLVIPGSSEIQGAGGIPEVAAVEGVARDFSPRVEVHRPGLVSLDIAGLGRLLGTPETIGRELQTTLNRRGLAANVAVAATRVAALLLALGRPGLTIAAPGIERRLLASLPLNVLGRVPPSARGTLADPAKAQDLFRRWGLRTLGELATLPTAALAARLGQEGPAWQRLARGEDVSPLLAMPPVEPIAETAELEWPVEGLEPLSFVLTRVIDPICERLTALDQAAIVLRLAFRLVSKETEARVLELPAPMRDAKVLRTLILLHLESHPLSAGVDRLTLQVEPAAARVTQFSLLTRALPFPEQLATLVARLGALMGERRVGAAGVVDSYRPGAFEMKAFTVAEPQAPYAAKGRQSAAARAARVDGTTPSRPAGSVTPSLPATRASFPRVVLSRYRLPVPARVTVQEGRPVRVTTERRGLEGGRVEEAAGPWSTSGEWWRVPDARVQARPDAHPLQVGWNRDEWDVALSDGGVYRIYRDRSRDRWFVDGICD